MVNLRFVELDKLALAQHLLQIAENLVNSGLKIIYAPSDVDRLREVRKEPLRTLRKGLPGLIDQGDLTIGTNQRGKLLQLTDQRDELERIACDDVGARDRRGGGAGLFGEITDELAEAAVDDTVRHQCRNDFPTQAVTDDLRLIGFAQRPWEIFDQILVADRDHPADRNPGDPHTGSFWHKPE